MEWTLGIIDLHNLFIVFLELLMLSIMIQVVLILINYLFINKKEGKSKKRVFFVTLLLSVISTYLISVYLYSIEISDGRYNYLYQNIKPYENNETIKSLLKDANKDNKISDADVLRILSHIRILEEEEKKEKIEHSKIQLIKLMKD